MLSLHALLGHAAACHHHNLFAALCRTCDTMLCAPLQPGGAYFQASLLTSAVLSPLQELQNSILDLKRQLEEAAEDQATLLAVQVRAECHMSPGLQHNTMLLSA